MTWVEKAFTLFVNQLRNEVMRMQTTMTTSKHQNHSILNGFPPIHVDDTKMWWYFCCLWIKHLWIWACGNKYCTRLNIWTMIKLTYFGISIQGSVNTYGDNNAMVKDTNILESTLSKKLNLINYHIVRKLLQLDDKNCNEDTETLLSFCIQIKWALLYFLMDHWNANLRVFILITVSLITVIQARFCPVIRFSFLSQIGLLSLRGERLKYDSRLQSLLRVNIR
jgi:hypothetical protein